MLFTVKWLKNNNFVNVPVRLPRLSRVREVQIFLEKNIGIPVKSQRLFFRGRLLSSKHTLEECKINYEDVVQLVIKPSVDEVVHKPLSVKYVPRLVEATHEHYEVGHPIEICDRDNGAWWDGEITSIFKDVNCPKETFYFRAYYTHSSPSDTTDFLVEEIRPRSFYSYKKSELKLGMTVLVNHKLTEPGKRGFWFPFTIKQKYGKYYLFGDILVGVSKRVVENQYVKISKQIFRIEIPGFKFPQKGKKVDLVTKKALPFYCDTCKDKGELCQDCGCTICAGRDDDASILLCDECGSGYHLKCLEPPLTEVPDDEYWYCIDCKNPNMRTGAGMQESSGSNSSSGEDDDDLLTEPKRKSSSHDRRDNKNSISRTVSPENEFKLIGSSYGPNIIPETVFTKDVPELISSGNDVDVSNTTSLGNGSEQMESSDDKTIYKTVSPENISEKLNSDVYESILSETLFPTNTCDQIKLNPVIQTDTSVQETNVIESDVTICYPSSSSHGLSFSGGVNVVDSTVSDKELPPISESHVPELIESTHEYYQIGDLIEICDKDFGAWWDGKITGIFVDPNIPTKTYFRAYYEWNKPNTSDFTFEEIRPRSFYCYQIPELKKDMIVLANHNLNEPAKRGYWYDFRIKKIGKRYLLGDILVGLERLPIEDTCVTFTAELMRIEQPNVSSRNLEPLELSSKMIPFYCDACQDQGDFCFDCGCRQCGSREGDDSIILCDNCGNGYHLKCLVPPLSQVPDFEWHCPMCQNAKKTTSIQSFAIEDSDESSSTSSASSVSSMILSERQRRTRDSSYIFGPIPGVEVGMFWSLRELVIKAGVHLMLTVGMHGKANEGVYSIILSDSDLDVQDDGEEILYTIPVNKQLSKKKLIDYLHTKQELRGLSLALALNCDVEVNKTCGAKAKKWKNGKPVRVLRSHTARSYSSFAPLSGHRYDGIYKVAEYSPKIGKFGIFVWTFLLRRDDPSPAPWTPEGEDSEIQCSLATHYEPFVPASTSGKRKRKVNTLKISNRIHSRIKRPITFKEIIFGERCIVKKPPKPKEFKLTGETQRAIKKDVLNKHVWDECLKSVSLGKDSFLNKVTESFTCTCCHELLLQPVTTVCQHNFCEHCLTKSVNLGMDCCPLCRTHLGKKKRLPVNTNLRTSLTMIFRGCPRSPE